MDLASQRTAGDRDMYSGDNMFSSPMPLKGRRGSFADSYSKSPGNSFRLADDMGIDSKIRRL